MTESEDIDFDIEEPQVPQSRVKMTLDDVRKKEFLKLPEVGQSITIKVKDYFKNTNVKFKTKEGQAVNTALSGKEGPLEYNYQIETDDGKIVTINKWGLVKGIGAAFEKNNKIEGTKLKITHLKDGFKEKKKTSGIWEVELLK